MKQANDAVESAKAAVELLFQAKANLPQGTWIGWLTAHLSGSDSQEQSYIAVAEVQPVPRCKLVGVTVVDTSWKVTCGITLLALNFASISGL